MTACVTSELRTNRKTSSQKHAELKRLSRKAARNIYDMLRLADQILQDHEYVDRFGGEPQLIEAMENDEFLHFGGNPSLPSMLRAFRANPLLKTWQEYRFNVRAMIDLAEPEPEPRRKQPDPAAIPKIIADVVSRFPQDITAAVNEAERRIKRISGKDETSDLVRHSIQEQIYDVRHKENEKYKSDGKPASEDLYVYFIGGSTLGNLTGKMLAELADSEQQKAEGHALNAAICRRFAEIVPEGTMLKRVVSTDDLRQAFEDLRRRR